VVSECTSERNHFSRVSGEEAEWQLSKWEINAMLDIWLMDALDDDEIERVMSDPKCESEQMYLPLVCLCALNTWGMFPYNPLIFGK
jgi:hypothetical protein